jgi:PAS domain S-box-containing protein
VGGIGIDATDRVRAEQALRESEERLRTVLANSRDVIYRTSFRTGRLEYVSPSVEAIFGYTPEELMTLDGEARLSMIHPDDIPAVRELMEKAGETGTGEAEYRQRTKSGTYRWVSNRWSNDSSDAGEPLYRTGNLRDITDHKAAEAALQETRMKYQTLVETLGDFIWEMDPSGRYTYCSPQMEKLWGMKPEQMIGKTPFDVMPDDQRESARENFVALAKSPRLFSGLESAAYDSRGRLIFVETSGTPFFDKEGNLLGFRGITRDITERKAAREAREKSEERYRSLFDNMTEGFALHEIILDEDGLPCDYRFLEINPSFERLTGLSRSQVHGKRVSEVLPSNEPFWVERYGKVALTGEPTHFESLSASLGRWYEVVAYRPAPLQFAVIFSDITKRKQAEEARKESEERFRLAVEHSQLMAWQCDREMRFTWIYNSRFEAPAESFLGKTPEELESEEGMSEFLAHGREVLTLGVGTRKTIRQPRKNGRERYYDQHVEPMRDAQGCVIGLMGISLDVSERVQAERQIQRSEESFRLMIGHSAEPMLLVDEDGTIQCISPRGAEQLGFDEAELTGTSIQRLLDWSGKLDMMMRLEDFLKHAPLPSGAVLRVKRSDGTWCWLEIHASFVNYGQKPEKYLLKYQVIDMGRG